MWSYLYLYKYLHKGPNTTTYRIGTSDASDHVNEITEYQNGCYRSAGEAAWRLLGYHVTQQSPAVLALIVHLPNQNLHQFQRRDGSASTASQLIRYLHHPADSQFDHLSYQEYFSRYTLRPHRTGMPLPNGAFLEKPHGGAQNYVVRHTRGDIVVRIKSISPNAGEVFYLWAVLQHHQGRSFDDLRTITSVMYNTWHEAAVQLGLFHSKNEGHYALAEAVAALRTPAQLRFLFSHIILEGYAATPLWEHFREFLIRDHIQRLHSDRV